MDAIVKRWYVGWQARGWKTAAKHPGQEPGAVGDAAVRARGPHRVVEEGQGPQRRRAQRALRRARGRGVPGGGRPLSGPQAVPSWRRTPKTGEPPRPSEAAVRQLPPGVARTPAEPRSPMAAVPLDQAMRDSGRMLPSPASVRIGRRQVDRASRMPAMPRLRGLDLRLTGSRPRLAASWPTNLALERDRRRRAAGSGAPTASSSREPGSLP